MYLLHFLFYCCRHGCPRNLNLADFGRLASQQGSIIYPFSGIAYGCYHVWFIWMWEPWDPNLGSYLWIPNALLTNPHSLSILKSFFDHELFIRVYFWYLLLILCKGQSCFFLKAAWLPPSVYVSLCFPVHESHRLLLMRTTVVRVRVLAPLGSVWRE